MALSKTQITLVCLVLVAAPAAWQWKADGEQMRERSRLEWALSELRREAELMQQSTKLALASLGKTEEQAAKIEARLGQLRQLGEGKRPAKEYRWDENSTLVRVPKKVLEGVSLESVAGKMGELTEAMKEALQLTESEAQAVQSEINRFLTDYYSAQGRAIKEVEPNEQDLLGAAREELRVFEVAGLGEKLPVMRENLFAALEASLGTDRFQLFRKGLRDWMPVDDAPQGLNTQRAVFDFDHRVRFYQPKPGEISIGWGIGTSNGEMMRSMIQIDEIPEIYRPRLQDWIEQVKQNSAPSNL